MGQKRARNRAVETGKNRALVKRGEERGLRKGRAVCHHGHMSLRPALVITDAVAHREKKDLDHLLTTLKNRVIEAAGDDWDIRLQYAEEEGSEQTLAKARQADAIVILGGEDVTPMYYGGESPYPREGTHWGEADHGHIALVRYAIESGIPLLGICRGMQVINVACGGSLVQDMAGHDCDDLCETGQFLRHDVNVDPESWLAQIGLPESLTVSSAHHQSIDQLGHGLRAVAWAEDGTIEAVECESAPVIGVQWHPEDPMDESGYLEVLLEGLHEEIRH